MKNKQKRTIIHSQTAISGFVLLSLAVVILSAGFGCDSRKDMASANIQSFSGEFRSVKGVKNVLSCYCYNSGYLTTDSGTVITLCFENDEISISCKKLKVSGSFYMQEIKAEQNSACPAGTKKIFRVKSYECID
jgi:hypothetical protein